MRCWPFRVRAALATMLVLIAGCRSESRSADSGAPARPNLPDGEAGRLLLRAIDAEGGWERWRDGARCLLHQHADRPRSGTRGELRQHRLVHGAAARRRAGAHGFDRPSDRGPLRHRCRADVDRQRRPAGAGAGTARGHPLRSGQQPLLVHAAVPARRAVRHRSPMLGSERGPDGTTWEKLQRRVSTQPDPAVPGRWFVLYIDAESGLIDRVHAQLSAPFLRHELWIGEWLGYRDCDGLRKERQRKFFPADAEGNVVGAMVAEQFVEHVRLNNGYGPAHFREPLPATPPPRAGESGPDARGVPAAGRGVGRARRASGGGAGAMIAAERAARTVIDAAARRRPRGLLRRRMRARLAARRFADGIRRRHRRDRGRGAGAVQAHRPGRRPVRRRARADRRRAGRGRELPRRRGVPRRPPADRRATGHAGGGRAAPRLHHQRHVPRRRDRRGARLRRRPGRSRRARRPRDRRSGSALRRGPPAHVARGALRGALRLRHRARHLRRHSHARRGDHLGRHGSASATRSCASSPKAPRNAASSCSTSPACSSHVLPEIAAHEGRRAVARLPSRGRRLHAHAAPARRLEPPDARSSRSPHCCTTSPSGTAPIAVRMAASPSTATPRSAPRRRSRSASGCAAVARPGSASNSSCATTCASPRAADAPQHAAALPRRGRTSRSCSSWRASTRWRRTGTSASYQFCRRAQAEFGDEPIKPPPLLRGRDLLALGYPRGPLFAEILARRRGKQLEGELTTRDAAVDWVRRTYALALTGWRAALRAAMGSEVA